MADGSERTGDLQVLQHKGDATRYRILVQIAARQPSVSQSEIAETLGITAQAVSQYLADLVEKGHVEKLGRGRYEITTEGVDWLLGQTDRLQEYVRYVSEEVIGRVDVEAAIATEAIEADQTVTLELVDGTLYATPGTDGPVTATALMAAEANQDVGVTNLEGLLDYRLGEVAIVVVPTVQEGGSRAVDDSTVSDHRDEGVLIAASGTEALALAQRLELTVDLRFGTPHAVQEAALVGLDVVLLVAGDRLSSHLDRLRDYEIPYEIVE